MTSTRIIWLTTLLCVTVIGCKSKPSPEGTNSPTTTPPKVVQSPQDNAPPGALPSHTVALIRVDLAKTMGLSKLTKRLFSLSLASSGPQLHKTILTAMLSKEGLAKALFQVRRKSPNVDLDLSAMNHEGKLFVAISTAGNEPLLRTLRLTSTAGSEHLTPRGFLVRVFLPSKDPSKLAKALHQQCEQLGSECTYEAIQPLGNTTLQVDFRPHDFTRQNGKAVSPKSVSNYAQDNTFLGAPSPARQAFLKSETLAAIYINHSRVVDALALESTFHTFHTLERDKAFAQRSFIEYDIAKGGSGYRFHDADTAEYFDATALFRVDPAQGVQLDTIHSYTPYGQKVALAGHQKLAPPPALTTHRTLNIQHHYNWGLAFGATKPPSWLGLTELELETLRNHVSFLSVMQHTPVNAIQHLGMDESKKLLSILTGLHVAFDLPTQPLAFPTNLEGSMTARLEQGKYPPESLFDSSKLLKKNFGLDLEHLTNPNLLKITSPNAPKPSKSSLPLLPNQDFALLVNLSKLQESLTKMDKDQRRKLGLDHAITGALGPLNTLKAQRFHHPNHAHLQVTLGANYTPTPLLDLSQAPLAPKPKAWHILPADAWRQAKKALFYSHSYKHTRANVEKMIEHLTVLLDAKVPSQEIKASIGNWYLVLADLHAQDLNWDLSHKALEKACKHLPKHPDACSLGARIKPLQDVFAPIRVKSSYFRTQRATPLILTVANQGIHPWKIYPTFHRGEARAQTLFVQDALLTTDDAPHRIDRELRVAKNREGRWSRLNLAPQRHHDIQSFSKLLNLVKLGEEDNLTFALPLQPPDARPGILYISTNPKKSSIDKALALHLGPEGLNVTIQGAQIPSVKGCKTKVTLCPKDKGYQEMLQKLIAFSGQPPSTPEQWTQFEALSSGLFDALDVERLAQALKPLKGAFMVRIDFHAPQGFPLDPAVKLLSQLDHTLRKQGVTSGVSIHMRGPRKPVPRE